MSPIEVPAKIQLVEKRETRAGRFLGILHMRPERTVQKHSVIQHRPLGLEVVVREVVYAE